uniref:Methyltransf_11 domain-containing protein n=1 Tax=Mesocestoides corti TaxID=53468 RepID=A0A5K3FQU8_MESCO
MPHRSPEKGVRKAYWTNENGGSVKPERILEAGGCHGNVLILLWSLIQNLPLPPKKNSLCVFSLELDIDWFHFKATLLLDIFHHNKILGLRKYNRGGRTKEYDGDPLEKFWKYGERSDVPLAQRDILSNDWLLSNTMKPSSTTDKSRVYLQKCVSCHCVRLRSRCSSDLLTLKKSTPVFPQHPPSITNMFDLECSRQ